MVKVTRWKKRGFTLSETLAAILIMGLVGLIVVGGFSAYVRSWRSITRKANAELFMSTLEVKMQEELEYASSVAVDGNNIDENGKEVVWFTDDGTGYATIFVNGTKDQAFGIKTSANPDSLANVTAEDLVSDGTSDGMYATYDSLTYDETTHVFTISKLSIYNAEGTRVLYQLGTLKIRNMNDAPVVK
ncbi:MAG: type II secretion system protein [Lactimicrobium sp.]|jgi:prepilin-type N-terminal cleavage/methylation domain-containing protein|uniref:type II secretion system protein n=1 Tax=Lactimicrobium sp. TaxID=2563780 RepID=UPI002F355FEA